MYFFNARLKFKIPMLPTPILGSVIAASTISPVDLQKRPFGKHTHLTRRYLDPQLYMASVDPALDPTTVAKLAAYPWFHGEAVPKYDSGEYKNRSQWKKQHAPELLSKWTRQVPTNRAEIRSAAQAAVDFQSRMGCEGIILAAPLTTIVDHTLQTEMEWVEAGLEACARLKVERPIFATIAISEAMVQIPALKNPLIHSFSNIIATRPELAGAYIVLEQSDPSENFWTGKDPLMSLLILIDDICRGAGKKAIVNYAGTFGLVASAVGAEIWSSGYYLVQRRFSLRGQMGRAYPRYHSLTLAGDVGLKEDLGRVLRAGLADQLMTPSDADTVLRAALKNGKGPNDVPEWSHSLNNCVAAQKHYLEVVSGTDLELREMSVAQRRDWVQGWLEKSTKLVRLLKEKTAVGPPATNTDHQRVWLDVFMEWRDYAKQ